ncbi:MAG: myo-inosose-2 dehydratase [Oscillospiraceae bacterium]|nr:myo-inosose-2 dehydratase [Oscillospiraceae bacterium]
MALFDAEKVKLGIAPIGWCNDDMPELGAENTFRQTVSEMALAGFTGCEIGNKYPTDPKELKWELDLRGMHIASRWFSSFLLTKPLEENIAAFEKELDFLAAVGADRINVSEQSFSIQGQVDTPILTGGCKPVMSDADWEGFTKGLDVLGRIASGRGFKLCFHHHMGTVVQTAEETDRMMALTDPRYVFLCYDTGHFTFAGEDPLVMLKKYVHRVGHVHLKDMRLPVVEAARKNNWSFLTSVRNGAFTVPGDGDVDFDPVFRVLSDAHYEGWLLVEAEQDPGKANPLEYAIKGRRYIAEHTGL